MSISAVVAAVAKEVVVKEVAVKAATEAALQATREVAQKIATDAATQGAGKDLQTAMMERQTMQDGFRTGEMPETKGEGREIAKQREADAAEELRGKLDVDETQPEIAERQELSDTPNVETQQPIEVQEATEATASVEVQSVSEVQEVSEAQETNPIRYDLQTRNQGLEGDVHPVTGVRFEKKTVVDAEGNEATGVFPKFESDFDVQLPRDMLKSSDKEQFAECTNQLKDTVSKDPEFAKKFSGEQLEQIKNGDTPDGYTWHHNEECGKMQLVKSDVHAQTGHTGGRSIWGGGSEFRV